MNRSEKNPFQSWKNYNLLLSLQTRSVNIPSSTCEIIVTLKICHVQVPYFPTDSFTSHVKGNVLYTFSRNPLLVSGRQLYKVICTSACITKAFPGSIIHLWIVYEQFSDTEQNGDYANESFLWWYTPSCRFWHATAYLNHFNARMVVVGAELLFCSHRGKFVGVINIINWALKDYINI